MLSVIYNKTEIENSSHAIGFLVSSSEELWNNITLNDENGTETFAINQHKILALRNDTGGY